MVPWLVPARCRPRARAAGRGPARGAPRDLSAPAARLAGASTPRLPLGTYISESSSNDAVHNAHTVPVTAPTFESGHGTGRNSVTLKQVPEVLSMGSAWKTLQLCGLGVRMHGPRWPAWSANAVGGPGSPHSDSVFRSNKYGTGNVPARVQRRRRQKKGRPTTTTPTGLTLCVIPGPTHA